MKEKDFDLVIIPLKPSLILMMNTFIYKFKGLFSYL